MSSITLAERVARVELLVLDVDGVLTDGRIVYADDGAEIKSFHVRDGVAIKLWLEAGKRAAIISGRASPLVARRAAELGIEWVFQGVGAKLSALREAARASGVAPDRICAMGDDLPDLPLLRNCGLAVAVADACAEVRGSAHWVTRSAGGAGAVREVIEMLLREQGVWEKLLERLHAERW